MSTVDTEGEFARTWRHLGIQESIKAGINDIICTCECKPTCLHQVCFRL